MVTQPTKIATLFTSLLQHPTTTPGSIASTTVFDRSGHPDPCLIIPSLTGPDPIPLPIQPNTLNALDARSSADPSSVIRISAKAVTLGDARWREWLVRAVFGRVKRELGLESGGVGKQGATGIGVGGATLLEFQEIVICGEKGQLGHHTRYEQGVTIA